VSITADLVTARKATGFTRVYPIGSVPASPPVPYVVIGYSPNAPQVRSLDGSGDPVRRFTVQHFGSPADALEDQATKTIAIFDGKQFAGETCDLEIATPIFRDPDVGGVLSITQTYRF
jgi:hypothetical protein